MLAKSLRANNVQTVATQMRFFGVMPKLARVELTVRTPYRTVFENCSGF